LLPTVVDTWVNVYLEVRAEDITQTKDNTLRIVQDELDGLAIKLEEARDALEQYREDNEVLSVERQENAVMSRLDGLNQALNTAVEEEVKAGANLDTLREAIRRGAKVVPKSDTRGIAALENELQTLRAQMMELTKRYTMEYINKQPKYRAIPGRIEELEVELAGAYSQGRDVELAAAEQAHAAAKQTVLDLQQKFDDHKAGVAKFNRIYATHQALADDLARLEELNREAQARQVQVEVRQVEKYPQVSVIERPGSKAERIGPDYLLLVGGTLAVALGLGVFSVWLYGYLGHRKQQPAYVTLSGVHMYPQEVSGELGYTSQPDPRLARPEARLLQGEEPVGSGKEVADDSPDSNVDPDREHGDSSPDAHDK
jgi:succinoglycan biosynthesis transport protein ExoP